MTKKESMQNPHGPSAIRGAPSDSKVYKKYKVREKEQGASRAQETVYKHHDDGSSVLSSHD